MSSFWGFFKYPCSIFALLLAFLVGYIVGTSPKGVDIPFVPESSVTNQVPPWPVFRVAVALNDFLARFTHATTLPKVDVLNLATAHWKSELTYAMAKHGIVDLIESNGGSITCVQAANALGFDQSFMCRLLHAVESLGLLTSNSDGSFSPSASGALLSKNAENSLRAFVLMINSYGNHMRGLMDMGLKSGRSGIYEDLGKELWEYLAENPEHEAEFDAAMTSFTFGAAASVISDYPLPANGKICDIGGGIGTLLVLILQHYPQASGIVFDRPEVVTRGEEYLSKNDVSDRAIVLGGDFFADFPKEMAECDVFVLKHILHDWSDEQSVTILRNVAKIAAKGAKIAVVEHILGESHCKGMELSKNLMDINMMQICPSGAKERSMDQYNLLFSQAGIKAGAMLFPLRDILSVLEVIL